MILFLQKIQKVRFVFTLLLIVNIYTLSKVQAQYCPATHGTNCSSTATINDFSIVGTTLNNLGTGCTGITSQAFSIYPPGPTTTATLILGQQYTVSVTCPGNMILSLWIDYNHDLIFDATEWIQIATTTTVNLPVTATITVPLTATPGPTGLRLRSRLSGNPNGSNDACLSFGSGESEDYTVTLDPGVPCAGTPIAGTVASNDTTVCPSKLFNLSLLGSTIASGLTFQWESSANNTTWTPIAGANFISLQTSQTSDTYYHCIVTCAGLSATSSSLFVTTNGFIGCYCTSAASFAGSPDVGNVTFGAINNGSALPSISNPAAIQSYTDYTSLPTSAFLQGVNYPLSISQINSGTFETQSRIAVFIDYDQNGLYDTLTEKVFTGVTNIIPNTNTIIGNVTIPLTAIAGITGMRVVLNGSLFNVLDACGIYSSGETEDYYVNIQAAVPCVAPPTAGTASATVSAVCPNINFNLNLTGTSIASGLSFQWESSPNGTAWTPIPGANNIYFITSITSDTYYHCIVTCNGVPDISSSVFVAVNSFATCYCTSTATNTVDDDIGNITFGSLNNGIGTPALSNSTSVNLYTNFTSLPPQTYLQGLVYPISLTQINSSTSFFTCNATVYIDYNHDGIFDINNELIFHGVTNSALGGNVLTGNVTIPLTSLPGVTGMRIVLREGGSITQSPCGTYTYGETEDYLVNIQAAVPCVAPPTAGSAFANDSTVCPSINFNLNLLGSSIAAGLSYQWESSSNGTSWTAISGATTINHTTSQISDTYYRCIIFCLGVPDTSTVVFISTNSFTTCYCTSSATDPADSDIGNVSISSLNNGNPNPATNNPSSTNIYTDFTSITPPVLLQGINYPLSITQINAATFIASNLKVYIDYNQDGIYDQATEEVLTGQSSTLFGGNVISGNIQIPLTASIGNTGMRVVLVEGTFTTVTPCGTYFNGETEDYIVTIQAAQPCTTPPVAGAAIVSSSLVCPNIPFDLNLSGSANSAGLTYQWEESPNGTTWNALAGATSILFTYTQTVTTYYRCVVTCSGVSSNSTPVLVNVNSFYNCYCNSGATGTFDQDIGNVSFGLLNNGSATPIVSNSTAIATYTNYTNLPPFNYIQSLTYSMSLSQINLNTFITASSGAVFIDFDHDGDYDPGSEMVLNGSTSTSVNTIAGSVTIPLTALTGITGMRVVLKSGVTPIATPCGTFPSGETEDYLINIISPNSCTVPFVAGFAKSNTSLVCASDIITLSIDSLPPDTGFTFQWQRSFDNLNWSNIAGATIQVYNGSQSFDSYYRCNVICNGGASVSTSTTQVLNKPVTQCDYCNTSISGNCSVNYFIDALSIGTTTFNNANSGCAANSGFAYSKYPINGNTTTDLGRGNYYDMFVTTTGSCNISVWIDYDQSGTFDAIEWIQISQATDSAVSSTVPLVLPTTAKLGATGMRVRSRKAGNINLSVDGCTSYGSGETEDYYVTIVEAISTGKELSNDKNVRIYPNPTTGMVSLEFHAEESKTFDVKIMSLEGQIIFAESSDKFKGTYTQKLDLSAYSKGIYFVQFVTDKFISTKKIVLH